jgi:putative DNA primase/helicase
VASGPRQPIPDLDAITWAGHRVFVVFDSDIADNPNVAWAAFHLAVALRAKGAIVRPVVLPTGPNGEKVGLDDYLVAHTDDEFRGLVAAAGEPAPPVTPISDDETMATAGSALERSTSCPRSTGRMTRPRPCSPESKGCTSGANYSSGWSGTTGTVRARPRCSALRGSGSSP